MKINPADLNAAQHYIQSQFDSRSWWPKEQPEQARHEFNLMQHDAAALSIWCDKWLDEGQCKKLERAIGG
jgi:hypothetical protein